MKLVIKYSQEMDVNNYLWTLYKFDFDDYGRKNMEDRLLSNFPPDFQKDLKAAKNKTEAKKIISKFITENFASRTDLHNRIINDLELAWKKDGKKIVQKLQEVYGKPFPFEEITIYLVSNKICPYNYGKKWIMVYAKASVTDKLRILLHELNHFMFYYYFPPEKLDIKSKQEYESFKEALTVLTSPEEQGYPAQQKLRNWLKEQEGTVGEILQNEEWRKKLL